MPIILAMDTGVQSVPCDDVRIRMYAAWIKNTTIAQPIRAAITGGFLSRRQNAQDMPPMKAKSKASGDKSVIMRSHMPSF
jgi:hypothetical protein